MSQSTLTKTDVTGDERQGVRILSPAPRRAWEQALDSDPYAMPTQTPMWTDVVCRAIGAVDASRMYEFSHNRRLVLPLVARSAVGFRLSEESMPYGWGYGGVLAGGGRPTEEEMRVVLADLIRPPVVRAALNPSPLIAHTWSAAAPRAATRVPYLSHVVDLTGGLDAAYARYSSNMRRNIRRAMKQPLEIRRVDDRSIVPVFADLNARSVDRWAAQRGQPRWLAQLVERRRDRVGRLQVAMAGGQGLCVGWMAHLNGVPVAVNITLVSGPSVFLWLSAMDKDLSNRTRAGALLQSLAIEHACAAGAQWFHLGESDEGSGVARFKEGFGAVPWRSQALRFERVPLTTADRRLHGLVGRMASRRTSGGGGGGAGSAAATAGGQS